MRGYYKNRPYGTRQGDDAKVAILVLAVLWFILAALLGLVLIFAAILFLKQHIRIIILAVAIVNVPVLGFILGFIAYQIINTRYENFILMHSLSINRLFDLNGEYTFEPVPDLDMGHRYDNDAFYNDISPADYLIYQLVHSKSRVIQAINAAEQNKKSFTEYLSEPAYFLEKCSILIILIASFSNGSDIG